MQKSQKGFTLIELVVVIVLLGILGVTALAKYQDLSLQATNAAISGIASELSSSAAINYAGSIVGVLTITTMDNTNDGCTPAEVAPLFASGVFPAGYTSVPGVGACAATGDTYTCSVDHIVETADTPVLATVICTGP